MKSWMIAGALVACSAVAAAQARCSNGPGVPFGILEYSCANCSVDHPAGQPRSYVFRSDPVVVETVNGSPFQPGDAISSVNQVGLVIAEGALAFASPKPGNVIVQVLRTPPGEKPKLLYTVVTISENCTFLSATPLAATLPTFKNGDASVDDHPITRDFSDDYQFVLVCSSACSQAVATDGQRYWTYADYPTVLTTSDPKFKSPSGMATHDRLIEIDGKNVLSDSGARALALIPSRSRPTFVVLRDGKPVSLHVAAYGRNQRREVCPEAPVVFDVHNRSAHQLRFSYWLGGEPRQLGFVNDSATFLMPAGIAHPSPYYEFNDDARLISELMGFVSITWGRKCPPPLDQR